MAAKDKTPNRTLAISIDKTCDMCEDHGTVSKSVNGLIRTRCLEHLNTKKTDPNAYLLKFLNLA